MQVRTPTLVGRAEELAALDQRIAATHTANGGAVFLVGEAGIGKTRLAAEAAGLAAKQRMSVLRGRASVLGPTVPYRALAEALLGHFRAHGPPQHADLAPYHRILGRLIPEWQGEGPPEGSDSLVVLAEAVLRVIAHAGREHGCLLVLDDLHGADAETLAVVEYLVDNLGDQPALLLCTFRTEAGVALDLVRSSGRRGDATVIELGPLDADDVRRLAAACLDTTADVIPAALVDRLHRDCAGNPFMVEEMLSDMRSRGALASPAGRWLIVGELPARVPLTVVGTIASRTDRLGEQGRAVLSTAAVLGRRFPLDVVQAVTGLDDQSLLRHLYAGISAQLVVPDEQSPDWYAFRHALTAEALLAGLGPDTRVDLASRCADVVEQRHPGVPGAWCQLAADLRLTAGDAVAAGRLFAEAGRRALAAGAANSAVTELDRARDLIPPSSGPEYADVLEMLLHGLLEAGQIDRALDFADTLAVASGGFLRPERLAALHTQVAWVAAVAGRVSVGTAQVARARALIGSGGDDRSNAPIDVVTAYLYATTPGPEALESAERAARDAVAAAERVPLPVVACRGWQLIGVLARRRSLDESATAFQRMEAIAVENRLEAWRLRALSFLAANDALRDGSVEGLLRVRNETMRIGAIAFGYLLDANIAFHSVLRGDFLRAKEFVDSSWAPAARLRFTDIVRYLAMIRAALAAHQGDRPAMTRALADFRREGGEESPYLPLTWGLCEAVCALLEEDSTAAYQAVTRAAEHTAENPSWYNLAGRHGLHVLFGALSGDVDLARCAELAQDPRSQLGWNRQFVLLAEAVLLGRSGDPGAATRAALRARETSAPFVMARHLGTRLVAEAALTDGWGDPVAWLQDAEDYFHTQHVPAIASACRALLRRAGATVNQHRRGHDKVPEELRRLGVTTREFDVLELVADRRGNKEIAGRLHLSPRTVEKHVASLIAKTGQADRAALCSYGAATMSRRADPT